jgi:prophage regulatory protein
METQKGFFRPDGFEYNQIEFNRTANNMDEQQEHIEATKPPLRLIFKDEVLKRAGGISYPTLISWMRAGRFPRCRELGPERVGWIEEEIDAWVRSLPTRLYRGEPGATRPVRNPRGAAIYWEREKARRRSTKKRRAARSRPRKEEKESSAG